MLRRLTPAEIRQSKIPKLKQGTPKKRPAWYTDGLVRELTRLRNPSPNSGMSKIPKGGGERPWKQKSEVKRSVEDTKIAPIVITRRDSVWTIISS